MKKVVMAAVLGMMAGDVLADNVAYNQAKQAGLEKCLSSIKRATDFIIEDGNAGAHSYWLTEKPKNSIFSAVVERNFDDGSMMVTNIVVAPMLDGGCYIEHERILHTSETCLALAQSLDEAKYRGQVNKEVSLFDQGAASVYLIPNGKQCTMVKKEIVLE